MATKRSLFSKPKWAAPTSNISTSTDDTPIFQQNIYEDARRAQRKYEQEKEQERAQEEQRKPKLDVAGGKADGPVSGPSGGDSQHSTKKRRLPGQDSDSNEHIDAHTPSPRWKQSRSNTETPSKELHKSPPLSVNVHDESSPREHHSTTVDSDDDLIVLDDGPGLASPIKMTATKAASARPILPPPTSESDSDPDEDAYLKELKRRARAQAASRSPAADTHDPVIALRVKTLIPQCEDLYVKRKASQPLSLVRKFFTEKNNLPPRLADKVFFTWNDTKLYNSTTLNSILGMIRNKYGTKPDGSDVSNGMIEIEAVTSEIFEDRQAIRQKEQERAMRRQMGEEDDADEQPTEAVPAEEKKSDKIVVHLKTSPDSGMESMMLRVNANTTVDKIVRGYMRKKGVDPSVKIELVFDGDALEGDQTVEDVGFEDGDVVDLRLTRSS